MAADLAGNAAPAQIAAAASAQLPSVEILVNNAALELQRRFHTIELDEIDPVVRVDLVEPIALTRLLSEIRAPRVLGETIPVQCSRRRRLAVRLAATEHPALESP